MKDVLSDRYARDCSVRFRETIKRVNIIEPALDIGGENSLGIILGIRNFTDIDLNKPWLLPKKKYNTITCFEILEHVQAPLLLLSIIKERLNKGGTLYLTTPVANKLLGIGKHHFKEYTKWELDWILYEAGFDYINISRIKSYNFKWKYFGIRPIIRLIRDRLIGNTYFVIAKV